MARFVAGGVLSAVALIGCGVVAGTAGGQVAGSTLDRPDEPVVLQQSSPRPDGYGTGPINIELPERLRGIAPSDLVAFRWSGGWEQVPVQVDEREVMDLNRIYGPGYPNCSDPCYSKPDDGARHLNYTDAGTYVGADTDPTLDADDEVALMSRDTGAQTATTFAPAGVDPASAVELKVTDPQDGGTGYVYLFEDAAGLDPSAGRSYVDYQFRLDGGLGYLDPAGPYKPTGTTAPSMARGPRPESSVVTTPNYTRRFTDRWLDDDLEVHRGSATGVDILDRHDAQFDSLDASCVRTQATYRSGEGAFVINRSGPVRAIRDFIGANSGPHVQRQHVFYDGKEVINTFLRVHAVPGVVDFFDYSAAGTGLQYAAGLENGIALPPVTIDGMPDVVPPLGAASGFDGWESVDGPQGGLSMVQSFQTNNPDPSYHLTYRDGQPVLGRTCNGDGKLFGASGPQANSVIAGTDEAAGDTTNLFYRRSIYYEAPGEADGAGRLAEEQNPLTLEMTPVAMEEQVTPNDPPTANFTYAPAAPLVGETVTFTSTSLDPDGSITATEWDLDGDGAFDDGSQGTAARSFPAAGSYPVSLRVTDDDGATAELTRTVTVACPRKGPKPKSCR